MHLSLTADEAALSSVVGTATFLRGRDYAQRGAVLTAQCNEDAAHILGQVAGAARTPYTALAVLTKSADGRLESFRGTCTCPVGVNCKHTVALVLASLSRIVGEDDGGETPAPRAPWERALSDFVSNDVHEPPRASVALQLEVVASTARPPHRGRPAPPRLGLRPVMRGRTGAWVRTGISWSNLGYLSYSHRGIAQAHLRLLAEILAMDSSGTSSYASPSHTIYLESLASRRIWDLLAEARSTGMPLVQAGKPAAPVTVYDDAADLLLDARRSDTGLTLSPQVVVGRERPALDAALLLGDPAHGIAWWRADGDAEAHAVGGLRLARFRTLVDAGQRQLVEQGSLLVPRREESRFFSEYYPALRQRVRVTSGDESVTLPEPEPPTLCLDVHHLPDHRLQLDWRWRYTLADVSRTEALWPGRTPAPGRDLQHESNILATVAEIAAAVPELYEPTTGSARLAASVALDGLATIRFTTDVLPLLSALPELTIESHGSPTTYREAATAPVVAITGSQSPGDRDWFDLALTVSVDDEEVPFQQLFLALSAGESHLILPSGTFFSLDRPEFATLADLIAEARTMQDPSTATVRLSRYQASLWEELDRLGVITGQAADWQRSVRALTRVAELDEPVVPETLRAVLRPYQHSGFSWLAFLYTHRLGGILADDMGLGKTLQTLALICHAKQTGGAAAPFLVVAPTSVVVNWAAECRRFAPALSVRVITETSTRRGQDLAAVAAGADIVLTSYTLFRLEYDDYAPLQWAGLILDEAQFVKNRQSRGHQCAKRLPTPFKLAITGTPMENNLMELWSLLSITAPGLFPSPVGFEEHYRTPIEQGKDPDRLAQLRRRVKPLMLRRTKEQVARDLPDKQEQVLEVALNPKHRRVYQRYLQRERQKVLGLLGDLEKNRFAIFRSLTLLRQACLDVSLVDPEHANVASTKLDVLIELLTEIVSEGHRTLVFSQFTRFLDAARRRLDAEGIDYVYLDGSTRNRTAVLAEFKNGTAPVFLISLKAGGFGLNLTEADYCILLDPWWNPATEAQAVDRVHRIGQTKKVMVYRLVAKDTIEEKVVALRAVKAALFGSVMNGGEFASGALAAEDIRGMLA